MSSRVDYLRDHENMQCIMEHLSSATLSQVKPIDQAIFSPFFEDSLDAIKEATTRIINSGILVSTTSIPSGLIIRLIELLDQGPQFCHASLSMLTLISAGLTFNTNEFLTGDFVSHATRLLLSPECPSVASSLIIVTGNLIGDGTLLIGKLLNENFMEILGNIAESSRDCRTILSDICWCMCNFTRHIRDKDFAYTTDQLHSIATTIAKLLSMVENNDQANYYLGWALSYSLASPQCANLYDATPAFIYAIKLCKLHAKNIHATVAFLKSIEGFLKQNISMDYVDLLVRGPIYQQIINGGKVAPTAYVILVDIWSQLLQLDINNLGYQRATCSVDRDTIFAILASDGTRDPFAYMQTQFTCDTIYNVLLHLLPHFFRLCESANASVIARTIVFLTEFLHKAPIGMCHQFIQSADFVRFLSRSLHGINNGQKKEYAEKLLELILTTLEIPDSPIDDLRNELEAENLIQTIASLDQSPAASILVNDILHYFGNGMQDFNE